ncbi:hypothetical protein Tco_0231325 [Tanacetum coccineum]
MHDTSTILTTILDTTLVITPPTTQTDTPSDPSEDPSSDHIPPLPAISQFLSSDDDTTDSDTPDTPPSPTHGHLVDYFSSDYFSPDDSARDSSSDSSSEASSDLHSDASSDSSLGTQVMMPYVRVSDEPHLEQDIDPQIQAKIDECIAYVDALRDRGIDARVVVEAVDRDETETGVRGPVEVRVERVTLPAMPEDIPKPAQEGAVKDSSREQGQRIDGVKSSIIALTEMIASWMTDNRVLSEAPRVHETAMRLSALTLKFEKN